MKSGITPGGGAAAGMSAGETPDCRISFRVRLEAILEEDTQ